MFRLDKHLAVLLTASSHGLAFREKFASPVTPFARRT
jgi:hypothetical protein